MFAGVHQMKRRQALLLLSPALIAINVLFLVLGGAMSWTILLILFGTRFRTIAGSAILLRTATIKPFPRVAGH